MKLYQNLLLLLLTFTTILGWIAINHIATTRNREVICDNVERVNESLGVDSYQCGNIRVVILD